MLIEQINIWGGHKISKLIKTILRAIAYTLLGSVLGAVIFYIQLMENRPDLLPWHTIQLQQEYTIERAAEITTFSDYLAMEDRLFDELQRKIYQDHGDLRKDQLIRYHSGSLADSTSYPINWNRSFELKQQSPSAGVLLLHGLSDSPYSLRSLAKTLHQQGYYVLGLRMPGHGTIPSGLVHSSWQDMAMAVKLAARHLRQQTGENNDFHIIGYSMGAAQAVNYALDAMADRSLPTAKSMVLISPAIGVSAAAALAIWQSRLSAIPGMEKLAWNSIGPEYDPYKYNSFAINAGDLMYRLTLAISAKLDQLEEAGRTDEFPKIQAFLSVVDATVSIAAVRKHLLDRVTNTGNEAILFDINRTSYIIPFLKYDGEDRIQAFMDEPDPDFRKTLLTNESPESLKIIEKTRETDTSLQIKTHNLQWPTDLYSLSHVALPFPVTDPLYGAEPEGKGLHIGLVSPRGEVGILSVPARNLLRLRYNPFYPYLQQRVLSFLSE